MNSFKLYLKEGREYKAVDFDGTLAHYTHWKGSTNLGKPIDKMLNRVKKWVDNGEKVKIFTARADDPKAVEAIKKWLKKNGLPELDVTNIKDKFMTEIWDDRAKQVEKNTGELIGEEELEESWRDVVGAGLIGAASLLQLHQAQGTEKPAIHQNENAMDMATLKSFITKHEGKRNKVYLDTKQIPTIGVGFNLKRSDAKAKIEKVGANYQNILNGKQLLTHKQIDLLLTDDINTAITDAKNFITNFDELPIQAKMVIVDMAFNLGAERLNKFQKLKAALEKNNYKVAALEMQNSRWYGQVKNRGKELVELMKSTV